MAEITIGDEDLRLLAIDRANNVLNYLVETGKIEAGRLFMVEPKIIAEGEGLEQNKAAVELQIK